MISLAQTLAVALLLAFPRTRIDPATVALVERAARQHGVPVALLAAVCFVESRLGIDPEALSLCGVRLHGAYVRDPERSANIAAFTLGRRRCRGWRRTLAAYHTGRGCRARDREYGATVLRVAARLGWRLR